MSVYNPPLEAMKFALLHGAGYSTICGLLDKEGISLDMIEPILNEAAKLARDVFSPLNKEGLFLPPKLDGNNNVILDEKIKQAYRHYCEMGWGSLSFPVEYGGQDLPQTLTFCTQELWQAANPAFGICPTLNYGAITAILAHGCDAQKKAYVPKLVTGEWVATMELTEANAGSDLSEITTTAVDKGHGVYHLSGQKIFISFGDHNLTNNIIHMVLAKVEGDKGLSLFIVPKVLLSGEKNNIRCTSLEYKMGMHSAPTCSLQYNEAVGYLVGEKQRGLNYMFSMMKAVRLLVAVQGVGIMERSFQTACEYARNRNQGSIIGDTERKENVPINQHSDVKRMLLTMHTLTDVSRCFSYYVASGFDLQTCDEEKIAKKTKARKDMLVPVAKAWCSDMALDVASLCMQVHGGIGYIEETGVSQLMRDARVLSIYEGANGILAGEFTIRKVLKDKARTINALMDEMEFFCKKHLEDTNPAFVSFITQFQESLKKLRAATEWVLEKGANDKIAVSASATPYLKMTALVVAGFVYAHAVVSFRESDRTVNVTLEELYMRLRFYGETFLPQAIAQLPTIKQSYQSVVAADYSE